MHSKEAFFRSLCGADVLNGTLSEFARWMATYIAVTVPEANVQSWWHEDLMCGQTGVQRTVTERVGPLRYRVNVACFVTQAPNEGFHVTVAVQAAEKITTLAIAKILSDEATCWLVASAASQAMDYIVHWGEQPRFVSMLLSLPGASTANPLALRQGIKVAGPLTAQPRSPGDGKSLQIALSDSTGQTLSTFDVDVPELSRCFFVAREVLQDLRMNAQFLNTELLVNERAFEDSALTYLVDEQELRAKHSAAVAA